MSPGRPDVALVRRHLAALDAALAHVRRFAGRSQAALSGDLDALWAVERGLQLCAQNALDIATHLAATSGAEAADYASSVDRIAALGVLPAEFAARFRGIAGFRNVLVHAYLELDLTVLHAVLNDRLDDFARFAEHVEAWLAQAERE